MTAATLAGKTVLMSGGSRGIGLAIALRAAKDGANLVLLAKTAEPHPKLEGTIYTAAEQLEAAGGRVVPVDGGLIGPAGRIVHGSRAHLGDRLVHVLI